MSALLSRRALVGAAMGAATIAAVPATAEPDPGMSDLLAKMEVRRRTQKDWEAYREAAFDPMEEQLYAAQRDIPHRQTVASYASNGDPETFLTTEPWKVAWARRMVAGPADCVPDFLAASHEVIALADARDAELAELSVRLNEEAIRQREGHLMDADIAAVRAILAHPCSTTAELLVKLSFITADDAWDMTEAGEGVAADVDRIGGAA